MAIFLSNASKIRESARLAAASPRYRFDVAGVAKRARRALRGGRRGEVLVGAVIIVAVAALAIFVGSKFLPSVSAQFSPPDLPTAQNPILAKVIDPAGNTTGIQPLIIVANNQLRVSVPEPKSSFRPGRYKLRLWIWQNGAIYFTENDFAWGVLVVNFNKSIYALGDKAKIGFGVLGDNGRTICDAAIDMDITSPSGKASHFSTGSTGSPQAQNKTISRNSTCGPGTVTNEPDYSASLVANETGTYNVSVVAETANGSREISDKFEVQNPPLFDVERSAPTRIFPPANYYVSITIKANQDFFGDISETAPASFNLREIGSSQKTQITSAKTGDSQIITWRASIKKGDSITLSYSFKAPDVSPELYKLGPLQIGNWSETRQWQIAADSVANTVIVISTTASTTWTVPTDWNNASNTIELIGGGGGGNNGGTKVSTGGGGGGGGAYAKISNWSTSTTGGSVKIQVGNGGTGGGSAAVTGGKITFFDWKGVASTSTCSAVTMSLCAASGGGAVSTSTGGAGGTIVASVATSTFGVGTSTVAGGGGGNGGTVNTGGGGGGGGAGGPNGTGGAGASSTPSAAPGGGGGGGGNGGGSNASGTVTSAGGKGGNNSSGSGGGAGGSGVNGSNGSSGGGGGGGGGNSTTNTGYAGGAGASSTTWAASSGGSTAGPGGGGAGGGGNSRSNASAAGGAGGVAGNYGAGGGGGGSCSRSTGCAGGGAGQTGAQGLIVITYTPTTITLADDIQPTGVTIGPGANATTSAVFTFVTNNGTSTISSVNVSISTTTGIYQVWVADNAGTTIYGSSTSPGSTSLTINTGNNMSVSTATTTFRTMIKPLNATSMPAVPGNNYVVTSTVTDWTEPKNLNKQGGNTTSSPITIDNASPSDVTNASGTAGNAQVALSWTDSGNTDATTTIVRTTSTVGVTWTPTEGTYYTASQAVTATNTIACVVASSTANCTDTNVVNGTAYYYKIFTADAYLNYSAGAFQGALPLTPSANSPPTVSGVTLNHGNTLTLTPNATTSFDINWSVSDPQGCSDINTNTATSTAFRNGVSLTCAVKNPTTDNRSCYLYITRATSSCSVTTINATDTVDIYYFADSTGDSSSSFPSDHWEAYALASDLSNATGSATSSAVNVGVLSAVNVTTSSLNYGSPSASSTSAEQVATTTNAGNSTTSIQLYALSTPTCSTGGCSGSSISTSSQRYASSTGIAWGNAIALTDSPATLAGITLVTQTSTANLISQGTFWTLNVPAGNPIGAYSGTTVFSPLWSQ